MIGRQLKRCTECRKSKPRWKMCIRCKRKRQPEQFLLHVRNPDGRTRICRACFAEIVEPARSTGKQQRTKDLA